MPGSETLSTARPTGPVELMYSFVVPVYNDSYLLEDFCRVFASVFQSHLARPDIAEDVELIFVDDGSKAPDNARMQAIGSSCPFVKTITLSRNFGQHIALSAGYAHASGRYVGMVNADQQDPLDQIPLLLQGIEGGQCDIIYGLRGHSAEPWLNRWTSVFFNRLLGWLTGYRVPDHITTLRVMNRRFVDAYLRFQEKSRFLPGLENWLGFTSHYVLIKHQRRQQGKSSYNFYKRLVMALEAVVSFSDLPLRIAAMTGMFIALTGFVLNLVLIIQKLFFIRFQPGFTSTVSLIVFFGGLQILVIGLASIYIGRILKEVQNRPLYVVKETSGFGGKIAEKN